MVKSQWIKSTGSIDELEQSVCEFLGIESPQETPQFLVNFRHSQVLEPEYSSKIAWCKRVEQVVSKQAVGEFRLDKLRGAIPNILSCAEKEKDVAYVPLQSGNNFILSNGNCFCSFNSALTSINLNVPISGTRDSIS